MTASSVLVLVFGLIVITQSDVSGLLTNFTTHSPMPFNGSLSASYMTKSKQDIWLLGSYSTTIFKYNIETQSFMRKPDAPYPIKTSFISSSVGIGNTIYINTNTHEGQRDIATYNIQTETWTFPMQPSIPIPLIWSCLTTDDRYLYAIGGYGSNGSMDIHLDYFQVYDTYTLSWFNDTELPSLHWARAAGSCEVTNGYVYVIGGNGIMFIMD